MWCGKCQADVAAEVSSDNQRVFCTICGALLSTIDLPPVRPVTERLGDRTKDARELLQRWSSGQLVDPFGPLPKPTSFAIESRPISVAVPKESAALIPPTVPAPQPAPTPVPAPDPIPVVAVAETTAPRLPASAPELAVEPPLPVILNPLAAPVDSSRPIVLPIVNSLAVEPEVTGSRPISIPTPFVAAIPASSVHRVDGAHPADHFASAKPAMTPTAEAIGPFASKTAPVETKRESRRPMFWFPTWDPAVWRSESTYSGSWSSMAGQLLAYVGVLGMTAGACMVVWSYFGGPTNYAPMGWLLATAGQMLLFFGVVTLVSGGLEQTTEQVNKRIEQLGDHIVRIEQAAREISLRGSVPPAHFGDDVDSVVLQRSERVQ